MNHIVYLLIWVEYAHVVSPRARGNIILATGNENFSQGMVHFSHHLVN